MAVDGDVAVAYVEHGDGAPVLCLPGWSQAAEQFAPLMEHLGDRHRVVALDHRGHGRSGRPAGGYRVHRLAADVRDALDGLGIGRVTMLGHSMGVAVIWAYLELFGAERVDRVVLADQRPTLVRDRDWTDAEARVAGASQTLEQLDDLWHRLRSEEGWEALVSTLRHMVSPDLAPERFAALLETNRATSNATRAALWFDQCTIDWRDLVPNMAVPTLVVHGLGSMVPTECQQWIADAAPDGRLVTIPADAGGSHFAFWESPAGFAAAISDFLA